MNPAVSLSDSSRRLRAEGDLLASVRGKLLKAIAVMGPHAQGFNDEIVTALTRLWPVAPDLDRRGGRLHCWSRVHRGGSGDVDLTGKASSGITPGSQMTSSGSGSTIN
jgi:hypothetical protein